MKIIMTNVEPLTESMQQDLGQLFLLVMFHAKMRVDGVRVEFGSEASDVETADVHD